MFSSSSSSSKKASQQQQEMVQVDRTDSESPFWKAHARDDATKKNGHESNLVVGAAYSHADLLKIDSLQISGPSSRPRTPPAHTATRRVMDATPPSQPPSRHSSPPLKTYFNYLSTTNDDWKIDDELGVDTPNFDGEGGGGGGGGGGGDDGDEDDDDFGLPSLSSARRKPPRRTGTLQSIPDSQDLGGGGLSRRFSNSADIAVERPMALYPMPKKSEGKILRPQYKDILRDPANALHLINHPTIPPNTPQKEVDAINSRITRINKFKRLLQTSSVGLPELKQLAWSGIPQEVRAVTWQLLLSYLPTNSERRVSTLERKRKEYLEAVKHLEAAKLALEKGSSSSGGGGSTTTTTSAASSAGSTPGSSARGRGLDEAVWHQIRIDVPRTNPHIELYSYETTKRSLERILYVWAVRHPASGYVQGINDLVTPFWEVFLGSYMTDPDVESGMDPGQLPKSVLDAVEADSFWCLTKLLEGILDHYIVGQPGIQRQVRDLRDLTARVYAPLVKHLEQEKVEFLQFSFRWMNCLLMREISVRNTIRMWDTYLAEEQGFSEFHLYVCAAFLVKWSDKLLKMDFQDIMMFLQSLPTKDWTEKDIELLLSEAFIWQSLFKGSAAHLRGPSSDKSPSEHMQL